MGFYRKIQTEGWGYTFLKTGRNFKFFHCLYPYRNPVEKAAVLPLEIEKFCKIVWHPLEIPRDQKPRPMEIPHEFSCSRTPQEIPHFFNMTPRLSRHMLFFFNNNRGVGWSNLAGSFSFSVKFPQTERFSS